MNGLPESDPLQNAPLSDIADKYAYWRALELTPPAAARRAGISGTLSFIKKRANCLEKNPTVQKAVLHYRNAARVRYNIDRDHVVEGLMEAVEVARAQSDSRNMIAAWSEIAKVTGVGAPERKEVVIEGHVTQEQLAQASDADLLAMLEKRRQLDVIDDAEFRELGKEPG